MKNTKNAANSTYIFMFNILMITLISIFTLSTVSIVYAQETGDSLFYNGEVLLKFHSLSDDEYAMTFTNIEGANFRPILVNNENVDGPFKFDIIFKEAANQCDFTNGIKRGEEFLLSSAADGAGTTHVLKYQSADLTNRELTFLERSNIEITYEISTENCSGQQIGRFNLIIAGIQYKGYINTATSVITLSLNTDQAIDGDKIKLVTKEGFVITMPDSLSNGEARVSIAFPSAYAHNDIIVSLLAAPANEVDARVNGVTLTEKQQGDMLYKYALLSNNLYVLWEQETDTRDPPTIYLKTYVKQNDEILEEIEELEQREEQLEREERREKEEQIEQREREEQRELLENNKQDRTITPPTFPGEIVTSVSLNKGWNLVSLGAEVQNFLPSDCSADKKLVAFVYISDLKKYVSIKEAREILGKDFGKYFEEYSFWVYSYSDCVLKTTVKKVSVEKFLLDEGWNLLTVPSFFAGKSFVDIQNSCDVLSAYTWKADKQQWVTLEDQQKMEDNGQGIIVKVDKSCIMQ